MSRLSDAIAEYRKRLLDQERQAIAALTYYHSQTVALIQPKLDALFKQMDAAMQNGTISPSWLYESQRLENILHVIQTDIQQYGNVTQIHVEQLQHQSVALGQQAGMALLNSTIPSGVSYSFGTPSPRALHDLIGATQAGPLSDLFNGFGSEAAQAAKTALISGVSLGYGPRQIAPGIQQALDISKNRALTIARTEAIRSYRGANQATFQANSDVVDQWRWTCALSIRTCSACLAMDGTLHDLDESMDSHPCCRCVMTPVTKDWSDILDNIGVDSTGIEDTNPAQDMQTGQEWFDKQDEATQQSILGKQGYQLYQDGASLQDFLGKSEDDTWGASIYVKSNKKVAKAIA